MSCAISRVTLVSFLPLITSKVSSNKTSSNNVSFGGDCGNLRNFWQSSLLSALMPPLYLLMKLLRSLS